MEELKLVIPTKEYENQVMSYREEFYNNGETSLDGCAGLEDVQSYEEWLDFENRLSKKYGSGYVPSSVFLAVRSIDNKVVGIIDIRHRLSDFLLNYGGHIGYSVLPSERKKGYAKIMLKLALQECKQLRIDKVLLTCDKDNLGSFKTIIANGGILENETKDDVNLGKSGIIQRHWITLKSNKIIVKETIIDEILKVHEQIPEFKETQPNKQYFENRYENKETVILCAYENNKAIGYIIAYNKFDDKSFYCWMAGVVPEYRKHGALTELMNYLYTWAKSKRYNKIKIKTRNDKRDMLNFLTKNGFDFTYVEERENIKDNRISLEKSI